MSILGLGPIWMIPNEALKRKAAHLLREGEVFAFGLSERQHGAGIYAAEMKLTPQPDDKPAVAPTRFSRIWQESVLALRDAYEMAP